MNPRADRVRPAPVPEGSWFARFRRSGWGFPALVVLSSLWLASLGAGLLVGSTALYVRHRGESHCPVFSGRFLEARDFGQAGFGAPDYRGLARTFAALGGEDVVVLPLYPYDPEESLLGELDGRPPHPPSRLHWLGTDDRGRDVFARLVHGFRLSLAFGLIVTAVAYAFGATFGALLGYYGGWVDLLGQRVVETWGSLPFLYLAMIVSAATASSFWSLALLLSAFGWMGTAQLVRVEVLRERARDYVIAAVSLGLSDARVLFCHLLPNALAPALALAPFSILHNVVALVSLDFLGFGLSPSAPSWGELMGQGLANLRCWWLVATPTVALFSTLTALALVGDSARAAFGPRRQPPPE